MSPRRPTTAPPAEPEDESDDSAETAPLPKPLEVTPPDDAAETLDLGTGLGTGTGTGRASKRTTAREFAELRAENARLLARLEAIEAARAVETAEPPASPLLRRPRNAWRAFVSALLIVIASVLAPAAVLASWATTELNNTDHFVANLEPLSRDPAVRDYVATAVVQAIESQVNIDQLTTDAFGGLSSLDLPPRISAALQALGPAAASGLKGLLGSAVHNAINANEFDAVWARALRLTHSELVGVLTGNQNGALAVSDTGDVGINLAPVIRAVKTQLQEADFPLADTIPVVNRTIAIGTVDNVAQMRTGYQALLVASAVLPWLSLALLVVGLLVARNRPRATAGAGIGLLIGALGLFLGWTVARAIVTTSAADQGVPRPVGRMLFDALSSSILSVALAIGILAIVAIAVGLLTGWSTGAVAGRAAIGRGLDTSRNLLDRIGIRTGRFGGWLYRVRGAIWALVVVLVIVTLASTRPLAPATVALTALIALVVLVVVALLQRPPLVVEMDESLG